MGIIFEESFPCFKINLQNLWFFNDIYFFNYNDLKGYPYSPVVPIIFLSIAAIGFILNFLLLIDYIKTSSKSKGRQSSMKVLFTILPALECIRTLYWIISLLAFEKSQEISLYKIFCSILSIIYAFIFNFEFIFINFILIHFRKISKDAIEGVIKPRKYIIMYISISLIATFIIILASFIQIGIFLSGSMNNCFIITEQLGLNRIIYLAPIFFAFLVICQVIYDLCCRGLYVYDKEVREDYKINSMYVLIFSLMHIPMFILIIITSAKIFDENERVLIKYRIISTFVTCSIPMIIGIIRNFKGFTKINKIKQKLSLIPQIDGSFSKSLNKPLMPEDQFEWLEKHTMEFFVRDILISIAHCIDSSKSYENNISFKDLKEEDYKLSKTDRITLKNFNLNDESVSQSDYLDVSVIEYAPKIFEYLRNLEDINIDEMVESFLPKNNQESISESQGKSGSFFISTYDNQYMVKTLRVDEFNLIKKTFLKNYVDYLANKIKNSLLCRIYGCIQLRFKKEKF